MALIPDIATLKKFIGGAGNVSLSIESIAPYIDMVGEEHLRPWLGDDQYEALSADPLPAGLTAETKEKILPYVQRPLALLTMEMYTQINEFQVSASGNYRIEDDKKKSIYKYQGNNYRSVMFQTGYQSIERLLKYLDKNADTYPLWTNSLAYKEHRSTFIRYATDFQRIYSRNINRFVFEILRPVMKEIEFGVISNIIGDELYVHLKIGELTDLQKELLALIQIPVAHFSMKEAMERNWVMFEGNSIVQYETLGDQGSKKATLAKNDAIATQFRHNDEFANRSLSKIHAFLKKNIDHEDLLFYKNWQKEQQAIGVLTEYLCREITETGDDLEALITNYLDDNCQLLEKWQTTLHHTHSHQDEVGHFSQGNRRAYECHCIGTCRCQHPPHDYTPRGTAYL